MKESYRLDSDDQSPFGAKKKKSIVESSEKKMVSSCEIAVK